jgi:uncharacterized protein
LILLDANVLMYAVGTEHPHKQPSAQLLERIASGQVDAAIDAETLQELLHRYRALDRWPDARSVYGLTRRLFPTVLPITGETVDAAQQLMDRYRSLMARDAIHAAAVQVNDLAAICTYDRDFDVIDGLPRIEPDDVAS